MQAMALEELPQLGAAGVLLGAFANSGSVPKVLSGPKLNPVHVPQQLVLLPAAL
jgi:hypothetical protein